MPEDTAVTETATEAETPPVESPPPAHQPARETIDDPRTRLHQLAHELFRSRNRRLLVEFLQLRRAIR